MKEWECCKLRKASCKENSMRYNGIIKETRNRSVWKKQIKGEKK